LIEYPKKWKKIFEWVLTGKRLSCGGSLIRLEATQYALI
jgi:glutamate dehydrogenase/leucine dehydrogenase